MIYKNKDYILALGKKALVYHKNHLLFMGDIQTGMKLFISNSDDKDLNIKLKKRLSKTTSTNPSN
tara:strand:- start:1308 stop:1502 length:195 start_codon:yes stop_codon:yes gene_type:complete